MISLRQLAGKFLPMSASRLMRELALVHEDVAQLRQELGQTRHELELFEAREGESVAEAAKKLKGQVAAGNESLEEALKGFSDDVKATLHLIHDDSRLANSGIESQKAKLAFLGSSIEAVSAKVSTLEQTTTSKLEETANGLKTTLAQVEGKVALTEGAVKTVEEMAAAAQRQNLEAIGKISNELSALEDAVRAMISPINEKISALSSQLEQLAKSQSETNAKVEDGNKLTGEANAKLDDFKEALKAIGEANAKLDDFKQAQDDFRQAQDDFKQAQENIKQSQDDFRQAVEPALKTLASWTNKTTVKLDEIEDSIDVNTLSSKHAGDVATEAAENLKKELAAMSKTFNKTLGDCDKHARETFWAAVYNSTTAKSDWLKNTAFSPSGWAAGYQYLYVLYRVLNEKRPQRILDLGLGQTSLLIAQYASAHPEVEHIIVESNEEWIKFFMNANSLPENSRIIKLDYTMQDFPGAAAPVRVYAGFKEALKNKVFDFISIDAPYGGDMKDFSRVDVLDIIPDGIAPSYVIMFDDTDRTPEKHTCAAIEKKLVESGLTASSAPYRGRNTCHVIVSDDNQYIKTM